MGSAKMSELIGFNLVATPVSLSAPRYTTTITRGSGKRAAKRQFIRGEAIIDPPPVVGMDAIDAMVMELLKFIRSNNLPPVTARDVYPDTPQQLWDNITPIELRGANSDEEFLVLGSTPRDNYYLRPRLQPQGVDDQFPARYMVLVGGFDTYPYADRITDYYQEERRLDAYNSRINIMGVTASANDMWFNHDEILIKWLTSATIRYTNTNPHITSIDYEDEQFQLQLLQSLFNDKVHVSQYRVTWVVSIIELFRVFIHIDTMLDPSMGWGDRLIGAMKSEVNYYGYDPNAALHPGYDKMIKDFAPSGYEYDHIPTGFEDAVIDSKVDFIITSPPYGDIEVYVDDASQSVEKYDNWKLDFYEPYLIKAWDSLREGGILVLQIGDNRNFQMVDYTINLFKSITDCIHWGQFLAYSQVGKYPNLHLVYRKNGRGPLDKI